MEVKRWKIADLVAADYNPPKRLERGSIRLLERSISEHGLIYPIAITKKGRIIDGHRRLHACNNLGWEFIPVIVVEGEPDLLYAEANATHYNVSGNQSLYVWLKNPNAVTTHMQTLFNRAETEVGRPLLEQMVESGMSLRILRQARQVARYVDDERPEFVRKALKWLMRWRASNTVRLFLDASGTALTLRNAVTNNRNLRLERVFKST